MKKRVLIIGPFGDFGGRELETGFIAKTLSEDYNVMILSTGNLTSKSQIFDFVPRKQAITLNKTIARLSIWFKILGFFSYLKSNKEQSKSSYISNTLAKKTGYRTYAVKLIKKELDYSDLVLICAQISSNYLREIVEHASLNNKPVILRTSATIKTSDIAGKDWLNNIDLFIHHSESNASRLSNINQHNYVVIDQCVFKESEMLAIEPTDKFESLLYIGRLSEEKGVNELVEFFRSQPIDIELRIIGGGDLYSGLKNKTSQLDNVHLLGYLNQNEIVKHIEESDAIVISSHEESGPLVGLEAMASARLVLSTKVGAMPYRLESCQNQFWFSIDDSESFLGQIENIKNLSSTKIKSIAEENRSIYMQKYKMSIIESQYKNTIFNLIK